MTVRAMFHDGADALAVADRLRRDGFTAEVVRASFAGEDDDEDQPWTVLTDAPDAVVELAADAYDGWVDHEDPGPVSGPPLPLPTEPIRIKRRAGD